MDLGGPRRQRPVELTFPPTPSPPQSVHPGSIERVANIKKKSLNTNDFIKNTQTSIKTVESKIESPNKKLPLSKTNQNEGTILEPKE